MSESDFERLDRENQILYGPPCILASGFPAAAQPKLKSLLAMVGLDVVPVVWVDPGRSQQVLADLMTRPDGTGAGMDSDLPRAMVVSGIAQGALHQLMAAARQSGMRDALWATVTPTSEQWPFAGLLEALIAERDALATQSSAARDSP